MSLAKLNWIRVLETFLRREGDGVITVGVPPLVVWNAKWPDGSGDGVALRALQTEEVEDGELAAFVKGAVEHAEARSVVETGGFVSWDHRHVLHEQEQLFRFTAFGGERPGLVLVTRVAGDVGAQPEVAVGRVGPFSDLALFERMEAEGEWKVVVAEGSPALAWSKWGVRAIGAGLVGNGQVRGWVQRLLGGEERAGLTCWGTRVRGRMPVDVYGMKDGRAAVVLRQPWGSGESH